MITSWFKAGAATSLRPLLTDDDAFNNQRIQIPYCQGHAGDTRGRVVHAQLVIWNAEIENLLEVSGHDEPNYSTSRLASTRIQATWNHGNADW